MKNIYKNRFLVWLMFLVPIAFTGWWSVIIWTMIQIVLCADQIEKQTEFQKPVRERKDIKEMNNPKNLTEKEKEILKNNPRWVKVAEGVFMIENK